NRPPPAPLAIHQGSSCLSDTHSSARQTRQRPGASAPEVFQRAGGTQALVRPAADATAQGLQIDRLGVQPLGALGQHGVAAGTAGNSEEKASLAARVADGVQRAAA